MAKKREQTRRYTESVESVQVMPESPNSDTAYEPKNDSSSEEEVENVKVVEKKTSQSNKKRKATDDTPETSKTLKDEKGNVYYELSGKRRITITKFSSGEKGVDLREWYQKDGEYRPGKGICLPTAQWKKLVELLPEINAAVEK
ncbi:hypothetical protein Unana1_02430 [Umbelopsis nana]